MIYRGPGFLGVLWFGSYTTPSTLSRQEARPATQEDWERETTCWQEKGGRGWWRNPSVWRRQSLVLYYTLNTLCIHIIFSWPWKDERDLTRNENWFIAEDGYGALYSVDEICTVYICGPRVHESYIGSLSCTVVYWAAVLNSGIVRPLNVPKCEIFDRSDFHDFYTIKPFSFWVGDFGLKYKLVTLTFEGARHQFLAHTLSVRIMISMFLRLCWAYA